MYTKLRNELIGQIKADYITFLGFLFGKRINIPFNKNILIIAPHPDDEIFGCGNFIYDSIKNNNRVSIVFLSKGEKSTSQIDEDELIDNRRKMAIEANRILGCTDLTFLAFPDSKFYLINEENLEAKKLSNIIDDKKPDYIFYPHILDYSPDHRRASALISKIISKNADIKKYYYCVWLWNSLPYKDLKRMSISNIYYYSPKLNYKKKSHDIYTKTHSSDGVYYSGNCPKLLYRLTKRKRELFFLINTSN
ncbi:PIG-L family deacetylase [Phocaeicola paurosaccharolyticus]|uniref:PIG-L family deacetylase n=1 Tax=Phocaeicola paurosaccharolyticus TaxID=732242 RepID=UPI000468EA41|nr:PIG-L family deacetylase [Phocaeicola paurosaccharolyticus]